MAKPKISLTVEIWLDIKRHFFTYSLLVLLIVSAFAVIYFTHLHRQATSELEMLRSQRDELDIEWRNLLLEQSSLSEHSAIETKAKKLLNMKRPDAESEIIITIP
jgi:cell division protein FtsL